MDSKPTTISPDYKKEVEQTIAEEKAKKEKQDKVISFLKQDDRNLEQFIQCMKIDSDIGQTLYPEDIQKQFDKYKIKRQQIMSEVIINIM